MGTLGAGVCRNNYTDLCGNLCSTMCIKVGGVGEGEGGID